jgi:hypothetical protein
MPEEGSLPSLLRLRVFSEAGGICAKCGKRIDGSREQWTATPLSSGDALGKLAPIHVECPSDTYSDGNAPDAHKVRTGWPQKRSMPFNRKSPLKRKISGKIVKRD